MTADQRPLTPEARRLRQLAGHAVPLGDELWILPHAVYARAYDAIRDRLYESIAGRGSVATSDVLVVAYSLLLLNYDLSGDEASTLLKQADPKALMETVLACLLGEDDPVRSYSNWVRSSLMANGLKPEDVPPEDLPTVLYQLQRTGRIVPLEGFSHIEMRKARIASLLNG